MLEKNFDPSTFENSLYSSMEAHFAPKASGDESFCLMMPPPNVTGSLHLGHALTYTLQDILVRYHRMKGHETLWQPGTDHAGIATQMVVERQLSEAGQTRQDLGREKFIERVWRWKEESGNTIVEQQRRLGISPDWPRSRFTMDEGLSKAVIKVFVALYKQNLIYRDKRLVNWDTKLQTAVSDLEVVSTETKSSFYYIRYLIDGSSETITVATTRPETFFGDTAVAVHPEDERYKDLIGKKVILPITGRLIPIIGDDFCEPEKGTGAVKITPGHDFNDFAMGQRHGLPIINILDASGKLNENTPPEFQGLSVGEARKKVVEVLEQSEQLAQIETITNTMPVSDRSGTEIQPWLTDQWFVDAATLAKPALEAVETGRTKFIPQQWENTYFEWLRNIQPWCISRQIWWGHQTPAWFGPDGHIFVEESEAEALQAAEAHYGSPTPLTRDTDVLDTWFSSALWPFSTLGWPDSTPDLTKFYPTDILVTGFDIIFFWVARMMMMGLHFMKDVPFRRVYIHALVRDEKGQKMSKSKGNVIDPLQLIDTYGADALRFTLGVMAAPGRDIKIGPARVETNRNFITKIWNATRFLQMNECTFNLNFDPANVSGTLNKWIITHLIKTAQEATTHLDECRFDLAAQNLYSFFWGTFCDIYVETLKPSLNSQTEDQIRETKECAMWVLTEFLKLIHPYIPFITELLWKELTPDSNSMLTASQWPTYAYRKPTFIDRYAPDVEDINALMNATGEIRSLKGLLGIQGAAKISLGFLGSERGKDLLQTHWHWVAHLARLDELKLFTAQQERSPSDVPLALEDNIYFLRLNETADLNAIKALLITKRSDLEKEIQRLQTKLANEAYKNAKPEAWEEDQILFNQREGEFNKLSQILNSWN